MTGRSFTVRGTRNGSLVHVTWSDGRLSGEPATVDLLLTQIEIVGALGADRYSARAYPEFAGLSDDPLTDPAQAYILITHVLDTVRETSGDVPTSAGGRTGA